MAYHQIADQQRRWTFAFLYTPPTVCFSSATWQRVQTKYQRHPLREHPAPVLLTLVTASERAFPCLRSPFCFLPSTSNFFLLYIRSKALGWALCSFAARQGLTAFFFPIYAGDSVVHIPFFIKELKVGSCLDRSGKELKSVNWLPSILRTPVQYFKYGMLECQSYRCDKLSTLHRCFGDVTTPSYWP